MHCNGNLTSTSKPPRYNSRNVQVAVNHQHVLKCRSSIMVPPLLKKMHVSISLQVFRLWSAQMTSTKKIKSNIQPRTSLQKFPVEISFQLHPLVNLVSQVWFLHLFNAYNRYFTLKWSGIKRWKINIKWYSQTDRQTDRQSEGRPGPESEEKVLQERKGIKYKYVGQLEDKQKRSIFSMPKNETSSNISETPVPYLHDTPVYWFLNCANRT